MFIKEKLIEFLNYRIEQEGYSSRLYRAMAIYLDYVGYAGAAKRWKQYSDEERVHEEWAIQFLLDLDIKPKLPALKEPPCEYKGGLPEIIKMSMDHEIEVTNQCNEMAKVAMKEGDFMLMEFAQKYLTEQREEIAKISYLVDVLETFGTSKEALRLLDIQLGED